MNLSEVKELMEKFDHSSIREFFWNNGTDELSFSKNEQKLSQASVAMSVPETLSSSSVQPKEEKVVLEETSASSLSETSVAEGEIVTSPLVGVVYRKPAPDKAEFINVGDFVKKGHTLLIIEAMKVMNEIPAPKDGIVTEILVSTDEVVEYGQALVRIK